MPGVGMLLTPQDDELRMVRVPGSRLLCRGTLPGFTRPGQTTAAALGGCSPS